MRAFAMPLLAVALLGCSRPEAKDKWCEEFYSRFRATDYIDQNTGRIRRDPTTNEIVDPLTNRVAITRQEEECIKREAQKAIDAYEGK